MITVVRNGQPFPWVVSDRFWARIKPLLPVVPRRADHRGQRRLDDLALHRPEAVETSDFYELIVDRHRSASTIITSNRYRQRF